MRVRVLGVSYSRRCLSVCVLKKLPFYKKLSLVPHRLRLRAPRGRLPPGTIQALARWRSVKSLAVYARLSPSDYAAWVASTGGSRASGSGGSTSLPSNARSLSQLILTIAMPCAMPRYTYDDQSHPS